MKKKKRKKEKNFFPPFYSFFFNLCHFTLKKRGLPLSLLSLILTNRGINYYSCHPVLDLQSLPFQQFQVLLTLFSESFSSFPYGTLFAISLPPLYLALGGVYHPFSGCTLKQPYSRTAFTLYWSKSHFPIPLSRSALKLREFHPLCFTPFQVTWGCETVLDLGSVLKATVPGDPCFDPY